ncbi:MAG: CE1 family esterase [Planctomycetota bacterium]
MRIIRTITDALIKDISATYNIDLKQVYAAGMSNGGFMTFTLACALNDKIAAIASVSGTMTSYRMDNCSPEYPIPVLLIHGTSDGAIPYKGGNSFDGDAFFTSVDQVMDFWVRHNQCDPEPAITKLADTNPSDGSYIEHYVYSGGTNQITTELFKVVGGGHTWPGAIEEEEKEEEEEEEKESKTNRDINAAAEIWKFFFKYDIDGLVAR